MKKELELKCPVCGKKTKHYQAKNGDYRCLICGNITKSSSKKEIEFTMDDALDAALNGEEGATDKLGE